LTSRRAGHLLVDIGDTIRLLARRYEKDACGLIKRFKGPTDGGIGPTWLRVDLLKNSPGAPVSNSGSRVPARSPARAPESGGRFHLGNRDAPAKRVAAASAIPTT
jgi:hypothetical protein